MAPTSFNNTRVIPYDLSPSWSSTLKGNETDLCHKSHLFQSEIATAF